METSKIVEEFAKYLNELLGYLLPGLTLFFLAYSFIDVNQIIFISDYNTLDVWTVLFFSYISGYIIYGASIIRDKIFNIFYKIINKLIRIKKIVVLEEKISNKIEETTEFKLAKESILKLLPNIKEENIKLKNTRSIAMSYCPEADQKIYTFMFRSELCNHVGFVFGVFATWILFAYFNFYYNNNTLLIKVGLLKNLYIPAAMFLFSYCLHFTRRRFLDIAYKIPLSIFLTKLNPIKNV